MTVLRKFIALAWIALIPGSPTASAVDPVVNIQCWAGNVDRQTPVFVIQTYFRDAPEKDRFQIVGGIGDKGFNCPGFYRGEAKACGLELGMVHDQKCPPLKDRKSWDPKR